MRGHGSSWVIYGLRETSRDATILWTRSFIGAVGCGRSLRQALVEGAFHAASNRPSWAFLGTASPRTWDRCSARLHRRAAHARRRQRCARQAGASATTTAGICSGAERHAAATAVPGSAARSAASRAAEPTPALSGSRAVATAAHASGAATSWLRPAAAGSGLSRTAAGLRPAGQWRTTPSTAARRTKDD